VVKEGYGKFVINFTDDTGTQYAVVGPTTSPSDADWQATLFAISSQCAPIPATACSLDINADATIDENGYVIVPFNCLVACGSPIDISRTTYDTALLYSFFDFYKYMKEAGPAFLPSSLVSSTSDSLYEHMKNATEQEAT
jgi:hypothetical protein